MSEPNAGSTDAEEKPVDDTAPKVVDEPSSDQDRSQPFRELAQQPSASLVREFIEFLGANKKWWVAPIVIVLLVLSLFVLLTNSVIGPFIYVLF
ncbi:MAG: DUF5989 family protein [Planctomycetota bacterium]